MPDTAAYYHAAYVIAGVLYTGYALSLWWRARRAERRRVTDEQRGGGRLRQPTALE